MTDYTPEDWQRLGRAVKRDRTQRPEYRDVKRWAAAIDRSTRVALGLERGEKVGDETLLRVEKLLGWPTDHAWRILAGSEVKASPVDALPGNADNEIGADVVALFAQGPPRRIHMRKYDDLREVVVAVRKHGSVIMDTTDVTASEAVRMVDFAAGVTYALGGRLERPTTRTFLLRVPDMPSATPDDQVDRSRFEMDEAPFPDPEDYDEEAASHSIEKAGQPEPERP